MKCDFFHCGGSCIVLNKGSTISEGLRNMVQEPEMKNQMNNKRKKSDDVASELNAIAASELAKNAADLKNVEHYPY